MLRHLQLAMPRPKTGWLALTGAEIAWPRRSVSTHQSSAQHFSAADGINVFSDAKRPTHIIVGGGSAGCVLANRLSEQPTNRVLLLEAGPKDAWWNWRIHMPTALKYNLMDDKCNCRGHPSDYERWGSEGAKGWSYASCLPYFKKAQTHEYGPDRYRGGSGPLGVTAGRLDSNPLYQAFVDAGIQAGYGYSDDQDGYRQEGFGPMDRTTWKGVRMSASRAYLKPVLSRQNLKVLTDVLARKVIFDEKRAVGIEFEMNGKQHNIHTETDIVLCGGVINTPQLMMLSGVGPGEELRKHGVDIVQDMPGVGANLQDHLDVCVQQKCTQPITLYKEMSWRSPHNILKTGALWFLTRRGLGATNHYEACGFTRTSPEVPHPNIQYHFLPGALDDHGRKPVGCHAFQVHVGPLRPTSRGTITLQSKDPRAHPNIDPKYLSTEQDRAEIRECVRQTRVIFGQKAFDPYRGDEIAPGSRLTTDKEIDSFVRGAATTTFHPCGTCKMGSSSDSFSVVDGETMKVHGLDGLRVVDASVMPSIVSGNLNGPVIMTAERAADLIQGKLLLDPDDAPYWKPNLQTGK